MTFGTSVLTGPPDTHARARQHEHAIAEAAAAYAALPTDQPVRLAKRTSNLFRTRAAATAPGLDLSSLQGVVEVDAGACTARVGGLTTYEQLVDELLPHGFVPLVVPQLRTITIGGAVTGLGIEAASFRNGLPHESVREMRILTGGGEVVTATPDGEHADLFRTFPNSYGSLGYALDLVIELEPALPYVCLRHVRFPSVTDLLDVVDEVMSTRAHGGERVDFVDGVVFSATESYLTLARWTDDLEGRVRPSDYTGDEIFYRSMQTRRRDVLTAHDYLWRWDTDWFWCSRAFGAQVPAVRRLWPRHLLRSDVYWRIVALENRHHVMGRIDRWRGRPPNERVVQDVEIPLDRTADFVSWFLREVPIEPIWLCPIQLRPGAHGGQVEPSEGSGAADDPPWPLYPMRPDERYVNVGFWSTVPIAPGAADGDVNRAIERQVTDLGGHKSLYSDAYYDEATFARLYGDAAYRPVKRRYDPDGRFPTLYEKAVQAR
ncbi:FAD/FMN-containing dehydrogenase [Humibacillus xanthopallidus]|uniref:Delta(24)-sterol reductase n=1 Tax=Humibacillus xanthopallidus TaxID=412689 RepID=A0A543PP09_9MICO|nr:FAD-binding oxidoreductase [Humibacillus xanthopallidus]TQN45813.1 FAD/FMN-containing dehydrogenase [Humibacillus xanthopallidus]